MVEKRQPVERVIGDVIDEDEPQRQPAARIEPQVTEISIDMNGRNLGSPRKMIGHDLNEPHPKTFPRLYLTDSGGFVSVSARTGLATAGDVALFRTYRALPA